MNKEIRKMITTLGEEKVLEILRKENPEEEEVIKMINNDYNMKFNELIKEINKLTDNKIVVDKGRLHRYITNKFMPKGKTLKANQSLYGAVHVYMYIIANYIHETIGCNIDIYKTQKIISKTINDWSDLEEVKYVYESIVKENTNTKNEVLNKVIITVKTLREMNEMLEK